MHTVNLIIKRPDWDSCSLVVVVDPVFYRRPKYTISSSSWLSSRPPRHISMVRRQAYLTAAKKTNKVHTSVYSCSCWGDLNWEMVVWFLRAFLLELSWSCQRWMSRSKFGWWWRRSCWGCMPLQRRMSPAMPADWNSWLSIIDWASFYMIHVKKYLCHLQLIEG